MMKISNVTKEIFPQKLSFDSLAVEVTRRCNLKCAHCLRGESQEIDISNEIIDNVLDQTEMIYSLFFTGGEPTLNLAAMHYILERLQVLEIPLHSVEVITNGVIHSADLSSILLEYAYFIKRWINPDQNIIEVVKLEISVDRYHVGYDPQSAIDYYTQRLRGVATVRADTRGNLPIKIGRAENLSNAEPPSIIYSIAHQVHTLTPGEWCGCRYAAEWKDVRPGQKIVCCRIHLSVKGDITFFNPYTGDYQTEDMRRDLVICNVSPETNEVDRNIDRGIMRYNQYVPTCAEAEEQGAIAQQAAYERNQIQAIKDLRWGWEALKENPKAMKELQNTIQQYSGGEEIFNSFLELIIIADEFAFLIEK